MKKDELKELIKEQRRDQSSYRIFPEVISPKKYNYQKEHLSQLEPKERAIFVLHKVGFTYDQIQRWFRCRRNYINLCIRKGKD